MRALAFLAALVLAPLTDAIGQDQPLQPGQRVHVTVPTLGIKKQAATFEALRGDVLVVVADSAMNCPLSSVSRLEVSRGRKSNAVKGLAIGSVAGVVVGAVLGVVASTGSGETLCYWGTVECGASGAAAFGVFGGLVGLGIGALSKTERWEEVPLDRLRVSIVPQRDGFGIGASIAF
ncbi:MAG: hypothetical protein OER90_11955 [Gemmatimonadota bacterium]|nr:hypothetical protein [Gemmatimonadota bacterium]